MRSKKTTTTATEKVNNPEEETSKKSVHTKRQPEEATTLSEQIEAFLKAGGKIQQIPSGVSGQPSVAFRRSMTISEKAPEKLDADEIKMA